MESGSRVDLYLFFSFDLAGANRLKAQLFDRFHWVELFRYFHHECRRLIAGRGVERAVVWKYLGDQVLFYQRIGNAFEVEHSIRAIDRALSELAQELSASAKYGAATEFVSPRAIAWLAPGFALAATARPGQISISAELADFLRGSERPVLDAVIEAGS